MDGGKVKNFLPSARRRRKQCSRTTWTSLFIPIDGSITWGINDSWTVSISSYWNSRASLGTRRISPSGKTTENRDRNHQIDHQYIDIRAIPILILNFSIEISRVVHTQVISFLKSLSERVGYDIERLWIFNDKLSLITHIFIVKNQWNMTSFKFRVVRHFPTMI